jgi:hypothetical protein
MHAIFENLLIMLLTIVVLLAAGYLLLLLIGLGLKLKSGDREKQGLTDLWIASRASALSNAPDESDSEKYDGPPERRH